MWSGAIRVVAAVQALDAVDGHHVRADPVDRGAHLHEHAREVLHVRLGGGVADDGRRRASARRPSARSRSPSRTARPSGSRRRRGRAGAVSRMSRSCSIVAPSALNASRCGSSRRRPITSPPGGGISARPWRASSGPASRKEARMRSDRSRSTSVAATPSARIATSLSPIQSTRAPRSREQREHRLDVADPRHVARRRPRRRSAAPTRGSAARRSCCRRGRSCRTAARRLG